MKLTFLGATRTVTGSKYLIEYQNKKILIDCGLFQGLKELRLRNWQKFPVNPKSIDAVILTHAHIDHSGHIPALVKNGFKGKIFASKATFDLCKILLPDSGFLQEEDARQANKYGYSKHYPALPLYTKDDAINSLQYFEVIDFGKAHYFTPDFYFTLSRSGHLLGSAFISIFADNKSIIFSGDLGRPTDPILKSPAQIQHTDYLVIESTYGDRLHKKTDPLKKIADIINRTASRGGTLLIPSFAVGRAQTLLYYLHELKEKGDIPNIPIFLDSPMAINASELLLSNQNEHHLSKELSLAICQTAKYVRTTEESKALNKLNVPSIIISASGMAEGGRVLHHLKHCLIDHKNTILFVGYQAEDTRGRKILRGDREIKIHGSFYSVRAEIADLSNISAHSDYEEILRWLGNFRKAPKKTFITHGELKAATFLQKKIKETLGWNTVIPEYLDQENL